MKVAFLFPGSDKYEALDNLVLTMSRYTRHEVCLVRRPPKDFDYVFLFTESRTYPKATIDADIQALAGKFAVIHNNDHPGVPTPGHYPSFCWTRAGWRRLEDAYKPALIRQPLFPAIVPYEKEELRLCTFGHIEAKKKTFEIAAWAKRNKVPFTAIGPDVLTEHEVYYDDLRRYGCDMHLHSWHENIEDIAPLVKNCSHFIFVLDQSKRGSGGSPTSPRFAGLFNRPVIVVDDEDTFAEDGFYVYRTLGDINRNDLEAMTPPRYDWSVDAYLDALISQTREFWS
jgi:hypothetical protein